MDPLIAALAHDLSPGEQPHLEALLKAMERGFRFLPLSDPDGEPLVGPELVAAAQQQPQARRVGAFTAFLHRGAVVDTFNVLDINHAAAHRFRAAEWGRKCTDPLWFASGTVVEVVEAVLVLPDDGDPRAPRYARHRPGGDLWLPGESL